MPPKIKLIIGSLAIVAIGTLAVGVSFLRTNFGSTGSLVPSVSDKLSAVDTDSDKDGLSDLEESYWNTDFQDSDSDGDGFLDGEEVASGHDPLIAGPDDIIQGNKTPQNITKKVSGLILAGLSEGSLKPGSPNYETSSNQIIEEIAYQSKINSSLSEPVRPLKTITDSPENIAQYAKDISPTLKVVATTIPEQFITIAKNIDSSNSGELLSEQVSSIAQYVATLEVLPVPTSWVSTHNKLILTLKKIGKNYLLLQNKDDDPLQTLASVTNLTELIFTNITSIASEYSRIYAK